MFLKQKGPPFGFLKLIFFKGGHRVQKWPKWQEKMNKQTDPKLSSSIMRRLQKAKKMGMFPSGLPDLACRILFFGRPQFSTNFDKNHTRRSFEPITKIDEVEFDLTGI